MRSTAERLPAGATGGGPPDPWLRACGREDLATKHARYRSSGDARLREELVRAYEGFARGLAARFDTGRDSTEDIVQAALVGLVHAVDRFDPGRGVQFTTYAWATITGELKRHMRDRTWRLRVPRRVQELYQEVSRAGDEMAQELGRRPTLDELEDRTGIAARQIVEAIHARSADRMVSLEHAGQTDWTFEPGEEDSGFVAVDERRMLDHLLAQLPERERRIVKLRFVDDLTQSQIGETLGLSQMQVSRLLHQILARLRAEAGVARPLAASKAPR